MSWTDAEWASYVSELKPNEKRELNEELDLFSLVLSTMKQRYYNWTKACLVCVPHEYLNLLKSDWMTQPNTSPEHEKAMRHFSQYCSHKNLLEFFTDLELEPSKETESDAKTAEHSEIRAEFIKLLYQNLARVFNDRGLAGKAITDNLFIKSTGEISPRIYQSGEWEQIRQNLGPYAYLLLDADSALARDPVSNRVATFIRRTSIENNAACVQSWNANAQVLHAIPDEFKPKVKAAKCIRTPLFALLLHHLGLNRAFLEYSAHYLDLHEYAPTLIESIAYYYNRGIHVENAYIDSCEQSTGQKQYDNLELLMELVKDVLKMQADEVKPLPRGISNEQCERILDIALGIIREDERIPGYLRRIEYSQGENAANGIFSTILNTSAFCFIWLHLHSTQVLPRVHGRAHAKHALLNESLSGGEMPTVTKNLLKHIVMAVHRSEQHIAINDEAMEQYLLARYFNFVSLTEKLRTLKALSLHDFDLWAQESQFAESLALAEGEILMYRIPADQISISLAHPIPDGFWPTAASI
ncbi:hypothetical protein [Acidovorax sp. SRB_14]|uniref:hypothetical protein n=1 Tax=Acidovorax sp. SRB_14 TaxID=1962699 RepID=UPI001567B58F|nr:hypothetical protein [Acidovorax sp. SRB_14]